MFLTAEIYYSMDGGKEKENDPTWLERVCISFFAHKIALGNVSEISFNFSLGPKLF